MTRLVRITLLIALALAVSGCGADETSVVSDGAVFAPASAPVFIELATGPDSEQWKAGERLLDKFPGKEKLLAVARKELRKEGVDWKRDVRPALPPQLYVVWLDFENEGNNVVAFAKPTNKAKFESLLETGEDALVHREVEGWTIFADSEAKLHRFEQARGSGDSLADEKSFRDAMDGLPEGAAVRGWVSGESIRNALERELADDPDAQSFRQFTDAFGQLKFVSFSGAAEDDGVRFEAGVESNRDLDIGEFSTELDDTLPSGALLYVSFGNLEDFLNGLVKAADEASPEFRRERAQFEKALGFTLESDLFPLFSKEGAIAVYRGGELMPNVVFLLSVDEAKANRVIERLAALAELSGDARVSKSRVAGVEVTEVRLAPGFSILAAVHDGKAYVSNSLAQIEKALGDADRLADDAAYQEAREAAGVPEETIGFYYVNLRAGLPYIFDFVEMSEPGSLTPEIRQNLEPLHSGFLFATKDGERVSVSGFLTIK